MIDTASGAWEVAVRDRLVARDHSALSEIYDQLGSYVFGLAARVIGDRHAAEDVTQEVFLSIWERPETFDPGRGRLRTFLGTLAHRRAVDVVRRDVGVERGRFLGLAGVECVRTDEILELRMGHVHARSTPCASSAWAIRASPSRMRDFAVPSGIPSSAATCR